MTIDLIAQLRPRRSVLYMPAANERALEKAKTIAADAIIFDLEDAVAIPNKPDARRMVADFLAANGADRDRLWVRVNPLASWSGAEINAYFHRFDLPRHPLTDMGYASIGCWTCTAPALDDDGIRAGRWPGQNKTECGIHAPSHAAAE